jgi:hypothetical protein
MKKKLMPVTGRALDLTGKYFHNCRPNSLDLLGKPSRFGAKLVYPSVYWKGENDVKS